MQLGIGRHVNLTAWWSFSCPSGPLRRRTNALQLSLSLSLSPFPIDRCVFKMHLVRKMWMLPIDLFGLAKRTCFKMRRLFDFFYFINNLFVLMFWFVPRSVWRQMKGLSDLLLLMFVRVCARARANAHTHSYMLHACRPELASTET